MTPTLPELLTGVLIAFSEPPPPESAGEFMAGKIGVVSMIALLAAQEAERGVAARVTENAAIRALFAQAAPVWDGQLGGVLAAGAASTDSDLSLSALDSGNAELRRTLIALHTAVDAAAGPDAKLQGDLLRLLIRMAELRRLDLPPMPPRS